MPHPSNENVSEFLSLFATYGWRFLAAIIAGGLLGLERQVYAKPAGLRTCILVSMGSSVITIISLVTASLFGGDPLRITAQIITGVGFIGGGVILHYRNRIEGITTAATIFLCAAVGITSGTGYIYSALGIAFISVVILMALRPLDRFIDSNPLAVRLRAKEVKTDIEHHRRLDFLQEMMEKEEDEEGPEIRG